MSGATSDPREPWLALASCGLDRRTLLHLLRTVTDPTQLYAAEDAELTGRYGLSPPEVISLRRGSTAARREATLRLMDRERIDIVPVTSPQYPRNLFQLQIPPPVLFVKGTLLPEDRLAISLVGPRNATPYGLSVTRRLAEDLAPLVTVISGAALGVDSAAHDATIRAGGRTLAVLGCGIDVDYPAGNRALREKISANGALISAFPPGAQPLRGNFPARNVVMAGLSLAVVVVEASEKSGALVTARAAGEEGRMVYAVPGDINRTNSVGSNQLLRDGATVCTGVADLMADLEPVLAGELRDLLVGRQQKSGGASASTNGESTVELSPIERLVLDQVRHHAIGHDDLINQLVPARLSLGELSEALLNLELDGHIVQQPGRIYSAR